MKGSQDQLEEVWEQDDGLKGEDFEGKTFFKLHGRSKKKTQEYFLIQY